MSAISYIYSQIKTQLETVVGIGYVGKWNNQLENDSRERQFKYPCVLIEFGSVEWLNTDQRPSMINTNYQQKGLVEITVHTLFKSVDNSTDTFESHIDFCKLIWDALTNFQDTGEGFTPLQRVRDIDDSSHDVVRDWQTVYSSMIFEAPNSQNLIDAAPVSISITAEYTPDTGTPIVLPICADADVYLNDSPIWTVASGGILELSIVNQDDVSVTPISVVGDVIKISDTGGTCADATAVLKDSGGTTLSTTSIASGASDDISAPDATLTLNGSAWTSKKSGSNTDINLVFQNGSDVPTVSVTNDTITIANLIQTVFIKGLFAENQDYLDTSNGGLITIDADNEGTFTTLTQDGSSGTITFEVNGVVTALPFTLAIGDTLEAFRTVSTAIGFYKISGTYV